MKRLRKARDLSQEELAHRAHTNQAYISLLETGQRSPSLVTLGLLADALRMRLSELVQLVEKEAGR